jgi:HPt (histidine-containing phosphotransfer) domain-containing protein
MENVIFDKEKIMERMLNDKELVQEVLACFMEDVGKHVDELKTALSHQDSQKTQHCAHTLKGAASNISALKLQEIALKIEDAAKSGDTQPAMEMLALLEHSLEELRQTLEEMDLL